MGQNGTVVESLNGYEPEPCMFCLGRMVMMLWGLGALRVHVSNGTVWCDDEQNPITSTR